MFKKSFYTALAITFFAAFGVHAQQDPLFTHYMFNNLYLTPAFAGVDGVTRLTAVHRSQWAGYQPSFGGGGAPVSQLISFNTPIYKLRSGFGTYILNDVSGPQNNLEAQAMYAYHLGIKDNKLSFGIKLGVYSQSLDYDEYRPVQPNDPLLEGKTGKNSQIRPDFGFGVFYRSEKYYAGVGFNHLLKSEFDFGVSQRAALENQVNFTGGYYYDMSFDVTFQFATWIKTDLNKTSVDLSALAFYKNTMCAGLSFRQSEAISLLAGYNLLKDKSLRLSYSLDYIVKDQSAKKPTSHELMLSYELPVNPGSGKKVVRTPRYRH
jgi:type IX secretion system PorP/SprF family membrane protein